MNIYDQLIYSPWLIVSQLLFWPFVLYACLIVPWRNYASNINQIWPAICGGLLLLWQIKATLSFGISIHLLGATLVTVLFGWQLAIIGLTSVLLGSTLISFLLNSENNWLALGFNGIFQVLIPVCISYHFVRQVFQRLQHNFFIYIFLSGFLNAVFTLAMVGLTSTGGLIVSSQLHADQLVNHYLPGYLLIIFPEGFITGAVLTLFVVYKPNWVLSFEDKLYLKK